MGKSKHRLDFTKPITTRGGNDVVFYVVYDGRYINGAYYESSEDIWYPCQWDHTGIYGSRPSALDLINNNANTEEKDTEL